MVAVNGDRRFDGRRLIWAASVVAALGWAGVVLGLSLAERSVWFAYLTAFSFVTSIALGALVFLMISYAVGAKWTVVIRRLNEAVVAVFPLLALCFVPLAFGLDEIYLWVAPAGLVPEPTLELLEHKRPYLNTPFFLVRTAVYFAIWTLCAWLLRRWSLARDDGVSAPATDETHQRERALSSACLPLVALALTFAAFDWVMSLQPLWVSTMFGVYYFAGGFVACFGLLALLSFAARRESDVSELIRPPHFHALGRLMFAFSVFWAYSAFFQAMLIQIADKPEEVEFYLHRLEHGWDVVTVLLLAVRFALPFLLLLPRAVKFHPGAMAAVGAWLLAGHYVDTLWLVAPADPGRGAPVSVWDAPALAAVGGTAVAYAAFRLRGKPLVPLGDPWLGLSSAYRSPL